MNSFIFSFRPLLLAAIIVLGIEGTVALKLRPSFVERSNYLDWTFGRPELFQKMLIYDKLDRLQFESADIVQVGDSSGLHGVNPNIVMRYLGGLRYLNLSCCANTGFDGFYDLARFALDRMQHPTALVLYLSINNLPRTGHFGGDSFVGGASKIHDALVGPWSWASPPSQALRPALTDYIYTAGGKLSPLRPGLAWPGSFNDMAARSIEENSGWWPEHDRRLGEQARARFFERFCGPNGVRPDDAARYTNDSELSGRDFLPLATFRRFAALAAHHRAKLIIVFQPHPCVGLSGSLPAAMDGALEELIHEYPIASAYPRGAFEHWPDDMFTTVDHLRIGYEGLNSARVGGFVATTLGVTPAKAPLPNADMPPGTTDLLEPPVWASGEIARDWRTMGISVSVHAGSATAIESANNEPHHLETTVTGLVPGKPYITSLFFKPIGRRGVSVILRDADMSVNGTALGSAHCDPAEETAARFGAFYDSDILLHDGWFVCWGSMIPTQPTAVLGIDILTPSGVPFYKGDGNSGIEFRGATIHRGLRGTVGVANQATTRDATK